METLLLVSHLIQYFLLGYFGISVAYILLLAIAGRFSYHPRLLPTDKKKKIAVLIPGYKEDEVIVDVARDALKQIYPQASYDVVIIADSFTPSTITSLKELPIKLIEVSFEKSTKAKAINEAIKQLPQDVYDGIVILDADNIMAGDFLSQVNLAFQSGTKVVQGHRTAKNLNTPFAILDGINEEINNHFFRKAHRVLGMSSGLIGSAMAFDFHYFRKIMRDINDVAGEDKEIELKILKDKVFIEYLEDAYVYDEKVQNSQVFSKQRTRWIASQAYYFKNYMWDGIKGLLLKGNVDFFDKAFQTFIPPRMLMFGSLILLSAISLVIHPFLYWPIWVGLLLINSISLWISVPARFFNKELLKALAQIPKAILCMVKALLNIKGADKEFIHTPHSAKMDTQKSVVTVNKPTKGTKP